MDTSSIYPRLKSKTITEVSRMAMPLSTFIGTFVWSRQGGPGLTSWSYLCPLIGCRKLLSLPPLPQWPAQFVILTADLYNEPLTTWTTSEAVGLAAGGAGSSLGSPDYGSLRCLTHIYLGIKVVTGSYRHLKSCFKGLTIDHQARGEPSWAWGPTMQMQIWEEGRATNSNDMRLFKAALCECCW